MQRKQRRPRHSPSLEMSGDLLPLNRSSKVPLYFQLTEILRDRIWSGKLTPGTLLPGRAGPPGALWREPDYRAPRAVRSGP